MKLHLPKALHKQLLAALLTVGVLGAQQVFAAEYTIGTSNNNDQRLKDATAEDKIIFDKDGGYLTSDGATINAAVEINKLKLTDGYSNVTYTFKNTVSGTGEFSFGGSTGANTQYYVFEGDMSQYSGNMTIADNKTGTFTFKGIEVGATSITGANVQFTDGASSSATIGIKTGRTLIIGHEGQNSYGGFQGQSVDLSGATVNLTGGTVRFNGDNSYLGTLNANGGTLRLEDGVNGSNSSGDNAGQGLNIGTVNLQSGLLVNNRWKGTLDIDILKGTGTVTFDTKNGDDLIKVKINSVEAGARILSNSGTLTLGDDAGSVINLSNTIDNSGSIDVNGTLAIDSAGNYVVYEEATEGTYTHGANGYYITEGSKYYAFVGAGTVDIADTVITVGGEVASLSKVDDGYVFTAGEFTNKSTFYVNEGKVTANTEGYTDIYEADTYRIAAGTELDVNGQYFAGASFILAEGAKLSNTGSGLNGNNKMFQSIELSGDATVHAHSNMGLLAFNSSDAAAATSTLKLNGHTLTKTGDAAFFLTGTTVEGNGTIKIQEGTLQVGIEVNLANTADTNAIGVDFVLDGGTLTVLESGNKLTAKSLSGTGAVTGNGVVELNNTGTAQEHTITGNVKVGALYLLGNDNYTINGNLTVSGAEDGYAKIKAKGLTLGEGTHSIGRLDLSDNNTSTATLTLNPGANLTVSGTMWLGLEEKTPGIKLGKGASLTRGEVKFIGSTDSESSISRVTDGNHGDEYGIGNASYVVKNAAVEVTSAENKTMYNRLQGVALSNTGTGLLTAGNGYNNLTELQALTGDIDLTWYNGQGNQGTISNLNIAAQRTVGAYTGEVDSAKATVTVSGLTAGAGATLNANLILTDGASLTFDGALALGNTTLTLGSGLTLNADTLAAIKNLSGDDTVALFTGVGTLTLGEKTYAMGTDVLDATSGIDLSKYFTLADAQTPAVLSDEELSSGYYLGFDANGTLYAGLVPEPTTATLSLLALAGLAARRRRK